MVVSWPWGADRRRCFYQPLKRCWRAASGAEMGPKPGKVMLCKPAPWADPVYAADRDGLDPALGPRAASRAKVDVGAAMCVQKRSQVAVRDHWQPAAVANGDCHLFCGIVCEHHRRICCDPHDPAINSNEYRDYGKYYNTCFRPGNRRNAGIHSADPRAEALPGIDVSGSCCQVGGPNQQGDYETRWWLVTAAKHKPLCLHFSYRPAWCIFDDGAR